MILIVSCKKHRGIILNAYVDVFNEYYEMCKKVKSICVEFNHELYGRVKVALKHFSNPQVMYGVSTVIENPVKMQWIIGS